MAFVTLLTAPTATAGNDDRRGTAGAGELLINPWAHSRGWGSVNTANSRGLDAFFTNIAGLSFVEKYEFAYSNTMLYGGKSGLKSGASVNAFGLAVRVGEAGVLGTYVMAMGVGDIEVTRPDSPEPGANGYYSPSLMNLNVAYSHSFTNTIHGGVNIKVVSESTSDVSTSGIALDAGIQYVTGDNDELKFGISLKNIGPTMSFDGTGMAFQVTNSAGNLMTVEYRRAEIELPTLLNIGVSYDFLFEKWNQRLTVAGNFTSNAFSRDNFTIGFEYSVLDRFQVRTGYVYQSGLLGRGTRATANAGLNCGASVILPLKKDDSRAITIDYAFSTMYQLRPTHAIGASFRF